MIFGSLARRGGRKGKYLLLLVVLRRGRLASGVGWRGVVTRAVSAPLSRAPAL